jgi:hypothetical protein
MKPFKFYSLAVCMILGSACSRPLPSSACESGDECVMIPVEDRCSENAQCLCGPNRVPGNISEQDDYIKWSESAVCLDNLCLNGEADCGLREEHLFCLDGQCGVAFDEEPIPDGADLSTANP